MNILTIMINNFEKIKGLLEFRSEDDFYFLQIIQRKKDHTERKINGTNNNSRLIKAYYLSSVEYLEFIEPEVIELCEIFKARAGINLNRRSFKRSSFLTLKKITDQIMNKEYDKVKKAYNSVCGTHSKETDKKWILDYDNSELPYHKYKQIKKELSLIDPVGNKVIDIIASRVGYHLISSPFNVKQAKEILEKYKLEVHKNNPTNLYIPDL